MALSKREIFDKLKKKYRPDDDGKDETYFKEFKDGGSDPEKSYGPGAGHYDKSFGLYNDGTIDFMDGKEYWRANHPEDIKFLSQVKR